MGEPDSDCIRQCLNGHPEAYTQLVRAYQAPLLSALAGRLGDRNDAEEAAQETFVRAFFGLRTLRSSAAFFPWLLGIARKVVQEQRRAERRLPLSSDRDGPPGGRPLPEDRPAAARTSGNPGRTLEPERALEVERAVAALPPQYQEVVLLRYYGGHSCAQVAELLGLRIGTVTKRLSRAHRLLREALPEPP